MEINQLMHKQPQTSTVVADEPVCPCSPLTVPHPDFTNLMDTICQRFLQAEQDFLLAAQSDDQLLADFAERWQTLQSDWEPLRLKVDSNTRQLVEAVATRTEELASDLYLVKSRTLSLEDDLLSGLEDVFASLTLEDSVIVHTDSVTGTTATQSSPNHDAISTSQWLLRNLHNPYPLPHVQFSKRIFSSKPIKEWFAKARQRIGWTRLLRDRFAGCRSLAIDAAFRAFVRDDPHNPLDTDLKTAFLAIKSHAELVYGDENATSSSPPKRPRSISPTPSLTFSSSSEDSDDERPLAPPLEATSKLPSKRASPDHSDPPSSKRRRIHESQRSPGLQAQVVVHTELPSLSPKKRRLSESDPDSPRPKRPRGTTSSSLHAVSDPSSAPIMPTWFNFEQSFKIPTPASTDPLDSSSFDLDFFNPPPLPSCTVSSVQALPTYAVTPALDDFSALFEIPRLDLLQSGLPTFDPDWTEFLNFEPDLSPFPSSPSLTPSSASTPPLAGDAILSPLSDSDPFSLDPLFDIHSHLSEKGIQFPLVGEPVIQEQGFLLPPGEDAGIPSAGFPLPVH